MTQPAILAVGTAVPAHRYNQMDICEGLSPAFNNRRAPAVFRATEIETRYSVLETTDWLVQNPDNETRLARYHAEAPPLGIRAIRRALQRAHRTPNQIDHLIIASCTGVDTPSLDVAIAGEMGLSPYLSRSAIVGMGCHAFLPALRQAIHAVQAHPQSIAVVLTLELCTLHFQHDRSLRNMLGSALFADGASAAVVGATENGGLRLLDGLSYSEYRTQAEMTFHPGNRGYKIHLSGQIPDLVRQQTPPLIERLLSANGLRLSDIKHWVVHPGGMKILDYLEQTLELENNELQYSRAILREYGNMSSATLLFVLERLEREAQPAPGDYGLLVGFGPGVTIELELVQW
ncbi:MAG: type III polyketide synthase [Caldilineae bacterium]|nr:MAG: type III polyketide synthase [Caldilineae bacterium]